MGPSGVRSWLILNEKKHSFGLAPLSRQGIFNKHLVLSLHGCYSILWDLNIYIFFPCAKKKGCYYLIKFWGETYFKWLTVIVNLIRFTFSRTGAHHLKIRMRMRRNLLKQRVLNSLPYGGMAAYSWLEFDRLFPTLRELRDMESNREVEEQLLRW